MLLKSASTPVLRSLLSSVSESPNHLQCDAAIKLTPPSCYTKILHCHSGSQNFSTFSCNSSPMSPAVGFSKKLLIRRAHSESNLEGLVDGSTDINEFNLLHMPKKFHRKSNSSFLESIPSYSFHNNLSYGSDFEDSDEEGKEENEEFAKEDEVLGSVGQFRMGNKSLKGYDIVRNVKCEENGEMFVARGLGVADLCFTDIGLGGTCGGDGNGGGYRPVAFDKEGGDNNEIGVEEHYKKMLEANPGNPLFLRNYAQFLYQVRRDLEGADEYYSRTILADPNDGEVLSRYAKLVWELHHDEERATMYFDRAVQAASEDSHVHAAYASFLWEVEDETSMDSHEMQSLLHTGDMASVAI